MWRAQMKREELKNKEEKVLKYLAQKMTEEGNYVELANDSGIGTVLTLDFEGGADNYPILAQYNFLQPKNDEQSLSYFCQTLTLRDDIKDDSTQILMLQAVNLINNLLPVGHFEMDPALEILSYKCCTPMSAELPEDGMSELCAELVFCSMSLVLGCAPILIGLVDGRTDWKGFVDAAAAFARYCIDL